MCLIHTPKITPVGTARRPKLRQGATVLFYLPANQIERWLSCERQARWHLYTSPPTDSYPSFSSQHWKLSSRPPPHPPASSTNTHTVACLSPHLSSIFQGALLSPGKGLLNFKYISRFSFSEMPLHGPTASAASGATSQWWKSHSTGGQTNRTPHTCGDTFCRLKVKVTMFYMYLCLYINPGKCLWVVCCMVQSCLKCLHPLVELYVFTPISLLPFSLCARTRTKTPSHNLR